MSKNPNVNVKLAIKTCDAITGGYNGNEVVSFTRKKRWTHPLDVISIYCEKEGIDYGEYQRREIFGLLPPYICYLVKEARRVMYDDKPKKIDAHQSVMSGRGLVSGDDIFMYAKSI